MKDTDEIQVVHLSLKTLVLLSTIYKMPGNPGSESSNGHCLSHCMNRGYPHDLCSAVWRGNRRRREVKEIDIYVGAILLIIPEKNGHCSQAVPSFVASH